jgi:pimeloyl-ACP methyl ester carboxylesterase
MEQKPVATCCSSVLFLPGIEASRLYRPESIMGGVGMTINRLWEPNKNDDVRKLFLNPDGTSIDSAIYAGSPLGRVFGLVDIYGSFMKFMDGLVAQGSISEWEPFGYDWRQSIVSVVEHPTARATTTESLIKTVEDMAARSQTGKVTLLAHSNGGLVAKQLVKVLADMGKASLIDSVISVAVPYLGTPQAIAGLLEGDSQSIFGGLILKKSVAKELGTNMASAYSLLPSATYFSKVFGPTIAYAGGTSTSVTTVQEQDSFISSRANALLMALAQTVHASIDPFVWPEAIHRWALVGWGNVTKKGIVYNNKGYTATTTIMGDSTVVAPSASYNAGTTTALDLPTISKQEGHKIDHANILGSVAVQSSIERIIASDNSAYNSKSIEDSLNAIPGVLVGDIDYSKEKTFLVVSTHSPVELHVYDSKGNHTGVAPLPAGADEDIEDGLYTFTESKIPGSSIELHGDDQPETFISLPDDTGQLYSVNIQGTGVGEFTYVVQRVRGGEVLDNAVYSSLPVTPLMVATTTVTAQTADLSIAVGIASTSPSIKIDIDGDGSSDIRVDANKGLDPISFLESLKKTIQKISDSPKRTKDIVKRIDTIEELIRKGKVKRVIGAATNLKKKVLHKKVKALSITDKQEIVNLIDAFLAQFE